MQAGGRGQEEGASRPKHTAAQTHVVDVALVRARGAALLCDFSRLGSGDVPRFLCRKETKTQGRVAQLLAFASKTSVGAIYLPLLPLAAHQQGGEAGARLHRERREALGFHLGQGAAGLVLGSLGSSGLLRLLSGGGARGGRRGLLAARR